MDLLAWETRRCQRYNHFCSLLVLRCGQESAGAVMERACKQLRATDAVDTLGEYGAGNRPSVCYIGAILPETDVSGARAALARLKRSLLDMQDVKVSFAVFPRDANGPEGLLEAARELVA